MLKTRNPGLESHRESFACVTLPSMVVGPCGIGEKAIEDAAKVLRCGGVVAFPTETVYGLGANALDAAAVAKLFEVKGRPRFDPIIVHVATVQAARELVACWPDEAQRLAEAFWPGPLTLVLPKKCHRVGLPVDPNAESQTSNCESLIPDLVTAGLPTVGLRVPAHPVALRLIECAGLPVAAPSANRFGAVSPTRAEHVRAELMDRVEVVLDGGPCAEGLESTVVSLATTLLSGSAAVGAPEVLRLGSTAVEAIEQVVGAGRLAVVTGGAPLAAPGTGLTSPGMLERHYAPRTPMRLVDSPGVIEVSEPARKVGLLALRAEPTTGSAKLQAPGQFAVVELLSASGDLREAAANLFAVMRRLDAAGLDLILAERVPDKGLGRAINDRLQRASYSASNIGPDDRLGPMGRDDG